MKGPAGKFINAFRLFVNHAGDAQYMTWAFRHMKKLSRFENKHLGESCFIIGNGPSLNRMDLTLLKPQVCFGLNKIYLHPDFSQLDINYHVSVNPLVIEQSIDDFKKIECPSFLSYRTCSHETPVGSNFYFIMTNGGPQNFAFNPFKSMSEGGTVTYVALQLVYFMGFSEVYLIGVDHSFLAEGNPNEKQVMQGVDPNHFHPDYFSGKEWHLPDLAASDIAYRLAQYYFSAAGRSIYDATVEGKLDVFEKISYESALARSITSAR